jgi:hypothetical protein
MTTEQQEKERKKLHDQFKKISGVSHMIKLTPDYIKNVPNSYMASYTRMLEDMVIKTRLDKPGNGEAKKMFQELRDLVKSSNKELSK